MKSLNRTLSLVLVLVMVLGLFGVAGAAFTDQAEVQYDEAVEVMTGIGAINGYTDGTIKPTGTITREEAAKLIAYSVLGKSVAEKLTVGATGFSDVAANRWSAPYISYLVGEGIINGMGDGTFAPTANVTGYQLGKMLLCANGYGAKDEFTGSGWELAVAVAANKAKIFAGAAGVDYTKPATREEAMLYSFNGIQVAQVTYNKLFDQYTNVTTKVDGKDVNVSIMDEVYPALTNTEMVVDGMASYRWMYKGLPISGAYDNASVLATSNNGTSLAKLVDATKSEYVGYQPTDSAKTKYFRNGETSTAAAVEIDSVKNGAIVKFIDEGKDSKYDTVSITVDAVVEVTADTITKTVGATTFVTIPGIPGLANIDAKNVIGNIAYAKGDYVMYHKNAAGTVFYLNGACEKFTGTLNAFNAGGGVFVIDGAQYKVSGIGDAIGDMAAVNGKAGTIFYKDAAGFVCKAVPAEDIVGLENVIYVLGASASGYAVQALAVFPNGTVTAIPVAKFDTTTAMPTGNPATPTNVPTEAFYTFTKNENGTYNLKTPNATDYPTVPYDSYTTGSDKPVFTAGKVQFLRDNADAHIANVYGTAKTQFVINYAAGKYSAYTGVANIPDVKAVNAFADEAAAAVLTDKNGYALFAVAYDDTTTNTNHALAASGVARDTKYVFPYLPGTAIYDAKITGNYYQFAAVVDGEIKTIDAVNAEDGKFGEDFVGDADGAFTIGQLTTVESYDNGRVQSTKDVPAGGLIYNFTTANTPTVNGGTHGFKVNGTTISVLDLPTTSATNTVKDTFLIADNAKIFIYDSTKTIPTMTASSKEELALLTGYNQYYIIQGVKKAANDETITTLFVTIVDDTAPVTPPTSANVWATEVAKAYSVSYYAQSDWSVAKAVSAVEADLVAKGWTIANKTVDAAGKYTFTVAKTVLGSLFQDSYTFDTASAITEVFKVTVPAAVAAAAPKGAYSATVDVEYAAAGATVTVKVKTVTVATTGTDAITLTGVSGGTAATPQNAAVAGSEVTFTYVTGAADSQAVISVVNT